MNIVLVRHGETDWNREERIQGRKNIPLNGNGRKQMQEIGEKFLNNTKKSFDFVGTSPLMRARESAEICSNILKLPLRIFPEFMERSFGLLEGKTLKEIGEDYFSEDIENVADSRLGMEDLYSLENRLKKGIEQLISDYPGEGILLVTHGSIIKAVGQMYGQQVGILSNGAYIEIKINVE